jgi:hypothetical protein
MSPNVPATPAQLAQKRGRDLTNRELLLRRLAERRAAGHLRRDVALYRVRVALDALFFRADEALRLRWRGHDTPGDLARLVGSLHALRGVADMFAEIEQDGGPGLNAILALEDMDGAEGSLELCRLGLDD